MKNHIVRKRTDVRHANPFTKRSDLGVATVSRNRLRTPMSLLLALIVSLGWWVGGSSSVSAMTAPAITVTWGINAGSDALHVHGVRFTADSTVTVAIFDGDSTNEAARKTARTSVAYGGEFSLTFSIAELGAGPNGSHDPAWSLAPGMISPERPGVEYGPNGSQDPAWSLATGMSACDSPDLVAAYDPALNYWTPVVPIGC